MPGRPLARSCHVSLLVSAWAISWQLGLLPTACRVWSQEPRITWELGPTGSQSSLRGLHAVSDECLWACGSQATVLRSEDAGSSWINCGPTQYAQLEFRSIYALDSRAACIASAGSPAVILRTQDAGATWEEVYHHASPQAFIDGLKFWNEKQGIAFGDPLDGHWLVVETADGGRSWRPISNDHIPAASAQEAGFAASNSAMHIASEGRVWIGTGGLDANHSRVYARADWDAASWSVVECPLISNPTSGIFSIATGRDPGLVVAVGGDYRPDEQSRTTAAYSLDAGRTWQLSEQPPQSFRSCVVRLPEDVAGLQFLATGPTGTDVSADGRHWRGMSAEGFHVLATSPTAVYAAGPAGRFARLIVAP